MIAQRLQGHVNEAIKNQQANHVLQKCIEVLPRGPARFILREIAEEQDTAVKTANSKVVKAATDKYGCRVLQRLIEHFSDSEEQYVDEGLRQIVDRLIEADGTRLEDAGSRLVNDPFANYVFQSLIEHKAWDDRVIKDVLAEDTVSLAQQKYSSHVLSAVLTSSGHNIQPIISALLPQWPCRDKSCPYCTIDDAPIRETGSSTRRSCNLNKLKFEKFKKLEGTRWGSFVCKQIKARAPLVWQDAQAAFAEQGPTSSATRHPGAKGKGCEERSYPKGRGSRGKGKGEAAKSRRG
jgi:hypothetical protein